MAIKIINAGMLSTIQDLGRYGFQRYGVSPSGVMDSFAARIANRLVSNDDNAGVIETTLKGIDLEFTEKQIFAITGGNNDCMLNGQKISLWKSCIANPGDILKMGMCKNGIRNYIAFGGGINVPKVMDSYSTNLKAKIGGLNGRKLQMGDIINIYPQKLATIPIKKLKDNLIPTYSKNLEIRVILGQQCDYFSDKDISTFFSSEYSITQESDRMGMRLNGAVVEHINGADIISDGITFGAIQIPGNGMPIIMMADRQTTGGYTKIGNVISVDLCKLGQCLPGTKIKFLKSTLEESVKALRSLENIIVSENSYEYEMKNTEFHATYNVEVNNSIYKIEIKNL